VYIQGKAIKDKRTRDVKRLLFKYKYDVSQKQRAGVFCAFPKRVNFDARRTFFICNRKFKYRKRKAIMSQLPPQPPDYPYQPGQYPQQPITQPPLPQQRQKKTRRWPWIVAIIIALFVGYGAGHSSSPSDTATTQQATVATVAPQATAAATIAPAKPTTAPTPTVAPKPKTWVTTQTFTGNGNKKTASFTIAGDTWKLLWSCDPTQNALGQYNVAVDVNNSDGTAMDSGAINTICKAGNVSGETTERQAGTYFLSVLSEDNWVMKVQEMK
jgi:hypothetical protein